MSLNQIGESIRVEPKVDVLRLARRGSAFEIIVHFDTSNQLTDFRQLPTLRVSLECDGLYLGIDAASRRAKLFQPDCGGNIPAEAILNYHRRKFDGLSASFAFVFNGEELWLRHSNSKLRVCN
jgi:hypothetical protein